MKHSNLLIWWVAIVLLLSALPLTAAAQGFMVDGIAYRLDGNDVVVTSSPSYSNLSGEINIPSSVPFNFGAPDYPYIQYLTVKGVDNNAFEGCTGLTGVTFESGTSIGDRAFSGCTGLSSVNISNSWTDICDWAFENCTSLTNITIPENVMFVGEGAFSGCTALETVNWNTESYIGDGVFSDCTGLKIVNWNAKSCVDSHTAFYGLTGITSFNFGNNVEIIPAYICVGLTGLTNLNIPESVKSIREGAFSGCSGLTGELIIPNSVTLIDEMAFSGCEGLTSVTIGNSVTKIGNSAFDGCNTLCSLYSKIEDPESVSYGSYIFEGVNKNNCKLYVPVGKVEAYQFTAPWSDFLNILEEGGSSTTPVYGDVNGDGKVNVSDVTALINMILGVIPKDEARADINGDGKINVSDVTALVNIILGVI